MYSVALVLLALTVMSSVSIIFSQAAEVMEQDHCFSDKDCIEHTCSHAFKKMGYKNWKDSYCSFKMDKMYCCCAEK
ncbi:hypothetical protein QYE76_056674 [Lolium multiflorum]|uniref:Uncharacterized protein n=1 Tax=Lolium multiflorum TaxID=4521 RepID=A0AAD8WQR6_LOLMU|nr:hypothetical protein QYE76_056674 [Lolium multiflorum]